MKHSNESALQSYFGLSKLAAYFNKQLDRNLSIIHGIGITEFTVMQQLFLAPNNTMSRIDLANSIGLSASGVTRMLNPMEKIGLVKKQANARDARVSLVVLSKSGMRIYGEALVTVTTKCDDLFSPITAKQQSQLVDLIAHLS